MLILKFILGLHSQSINFTKTFDQEDIPSGEIVFIEIHWDINSDGGKCDVVLIIKKILYGKTEEVRLWYKFFRSCLLERGFLMIKVDPCMFMLKTVICMVYVDG